MSDFNEKAIPMTDHRSGTIAEEELLTAGKAWNDLCEKDDRSSPEDYPDHCLITREELADYMARSVERRVLSPRTEPTSDAVERAAKAIYTSLNSIAPDRSIPSLARSTYREAARAALSAASISTKDDPVGDGALAGIDSASGLLRKHAENASREQARTLRWAADAIDTLKSGVPPSLATHKFDTSGYIIDPVGPRGGGWRPIETAPKDGTRLLVWAPDSMYGNPFTAHWVDDEFDPEDSGWFEHEDGSGRCVDVEVTHWQPLPSPPAALLVEGKEQ